MSTESVIKTDALIKALSDPEIGDSSVDAHTLSEDTVGMCDPITHEFLFSMMLWESSIEQAQRAMGKIYEQFVDVNEVRVALPSEIVTLIGGRYPLSEERAERMIATLRLVYSKFGRAGLGPVQESGKRDGRKTLLALEPLPRFVASRVLMFALDAHAFPVDRKLAKALADHGIASNHKDPDAMSAQLERDILSSDATSVYNRLEHWLARELEMAREKRSNSKSGGDAS